MSFVIEPDFVIYIYDIFGNRSMAIQEMSDITVEDRHQGMETLTFTVRSEDEKTNYLIADVEVEFGNRIYRIQERNEERLKSRGLIQVYCEARWVELVDRKRVGLTSVLALTPSQGMTAILVGTGWIVGSAPLSIVQYSMEETDASYLELLRRWAAITGYELQFDTVNKVVDLITAQGSDKGLGFTYGRNLATITRKYRPPAVTRLYAYGGNNLSIAAVNPSGMEFIENYSWYTSQGMTLTQAATKYRKDYIWVDERYLLAINLYDAAVKKMASLSVPVVSYSCSVINLAQLTGSSLDDVVMGDTVRVDDEILNVTIKARVVRLVRKPQEPKGDLIELSFLEPGVNQLQDSASRGSSPGDIVYLVSRNDVAKTVTSSPLEYAAISLTTSGESTFICGSTFQGTATGTGTLTVKMTVDGNNVGVPLTIPFTDGQVVEKSWPTFQSGIETGPHAVSWTAQVTTGAGTITLPAEAGRSWLLTRGAVGIGVSASPNQLVGDILGIVVIGMDAAALSEILDHHDPNPGDTLTTKQVTLSDTTVLPVVTFF
jgi:phage minor structural protein